MSARSFTLAAWAIVAFGLSTACSTSRELIPLNGPDGNPIRFVYRHEMRAKDADRRDALEGALVAVKSSDDAVWQIDFTDAAGGVRLSQEYAKMDVYNDKRTTFFVQTQNSITLRTPAFQMSVIHPSYEAYHVGYGSTNFLDRPHLCPDPASPTAYPAGVTPHAFAQLSRPFLVPLDVREGLERPPTGTAAPAPTLAWLAESLGGPSVELRRQADQPGGGGGAFTIGLWAHDGRFTRTTGHALALERGARLFFRVEDEAYLLVGPTFLEGESRASEARLRALADTADVVLASIEAYPEGKEAPSRRWVRADREAGAAGDARRGVLTAALQAALKAGAKRTAILFPPDQLGAIDARVRELGFEALAEWWLPTIEARPASE